MYKVMKLIALAAVVLVVLVTCNIFDNLAESAGYRERNVNGYKPVPLESPRVVWERVKAANPGVSDDEISAAITAFCDLGTVTGTRHDFCNDPNHPPMTDLVGIEDLRNSLNRLAFGVSSRVIMKTELPVAVYDASGIKQAGQFKPWGNIIEDSDEDPSIIQPHKGPGRQIVLTAINQTNNAGKIAGSEDGISFYFKRVPKDVNFRISADFYVDVFGFTAGRSELNGQEAFGFMARDYVPQHTSIANRHNLTMEHLKNVPWDGVYWNGQDTALNDGISGSSNMIMVGGVKRGTRVYWRNGVTDPDGEKKPITDPNTIANADFAKFNYTPREFSDYSMYGSGIGGTQSRPDFPTAGLTYSLYLEKTNSGFIAKIIPPKGVGKGITKDRKAADGFELVYTDRELPFPDMLCGPTSVDQDYYYVGVFAARDAKVTVTNLKYEEAPSDLCAVRIDPVPEEVVPTFSVQSPVATSSDNYMLVARSNVEGLLSLSVNGGESKVYPASWIVETTNASARPFSLFEIEDIKLKTGDNTFDMVFIPDNKQLKSGFLGYIEKSPGNVVQVEPLEYFMGKYNANDPPVYKNATGVLAGGAGINRTRITQSFMVNRRELGGTDFFPNSKLTLYKASGKDQIAREIIWVAPDGRSTGSGSYDNPLDIKTAIAVSSISSATKSGQMIVLKNGIYTPIDSPEMVEGKIRTPIRMIVPRYNSGRPNPDVENPQPRPTGAEPWHPYPDPYADEYYRYYKVLIAEERNKVIFDFRKDLRNGGYAPRAFEHRGDYWIIDGIHVRNAEDNYKGLTIMGSHNLVRWVKTYFNGDTGLQISGNNDEPKSVWPSYNRIEYCESFGNADQSRTNADGFASKLTTWTGNVFYRTISHHNIDDGYDLFAKKETGPIGALLIEQCFAYSNGRYLNDEMGRNYSEEDMPVTRNDSAGVGGNGFKMGGEGIPVLHLAIDCLSFGNDGDGFTSNSDPAIRLTHVTAFNNYNRLDSNPGSNYSIYSASSPSYEGLDGIITQVLSWHSSYTGRRNDRLEPTSPSSGYVWRNNATRPAAGGVTVEYEVYDGNNGKETAVLDLKTFQYDPNFPVLAGRSASTLFVSGKDRQNGVDVNNYINNNFITIQNFERDPEDYFLYVYEDNDPKKHVDVMNSKRLIFTGNGLSPWDGLPGDMPYRRLDGSTAPNRADGKIEGDFMEIYQEMEGGDSNSYYWGLPKLDKFMKLKDVGNPGVKPGARGLW